MEYEKTKNNCILKVLKNFTSKSSDKFKENELYRCVALSIKTKNDKETMLVQEETGSEAYCTIVEVMDHMEYYKAPLRNEIHVGSRVVTLKDGKLLNGKVRGIDGDNYVVSINGISSFTNIEEAVVDKNSVANFEDCCTIVRDYKKDPNGFYLRYEYGMEYLPTHKPLDEWKLGLKEGSSGFVDLN